MAPTSHPVLAVLAALALAACAGPAVVVTHIAQDSLYAPQLLRGERALPVVATGPGGAAAGKGWAEAAARALAAVAPLRPAASPPPGGFHLAVAVAPPPATAAADVCAGAARPAASHAADEGSVIVALCHRRAPIASARATVAAFSRPDSPLLALAVQAAAAQAFPPRPPNTPDAPEIQLPLP